MGGDVKTYGNCAGHFALRVCAAVTLLLAAWWLVN